MSRMKSFALYFFLISSFFVIFYLLEVVAPIYKGLLFSSVIGAVVFCRVSLRKLLSASTSFLSVFCLLTYLYILPERSLTLGMLKHVEGSSSTMQDLEKYIERDYLHEYRAVDERINEQLLAGSIVVEGNTVSLTRLGSFYLRFFNLTTIFFGSSRFNNK